MIRSTLCTFTKQTIGRERRLTSTKQRSLTVLVRRRRQSGRGHWKNARGSGSSRSSRVPPRRGPGPPSSRECVGVALRLPSPARLSDRLGLGLDRRLIPAPHRAEEIAPLAHPTALRGHPRRDGREGCRTSDSPDAVVQAVDHALTSPRPRTRYLAGTDAKIRA